MSMVDAIGAFISFFSRQVWQLNFSDSSSDHHGNKLKYVAIEIGINKILIII